ncbi:transcription antitermination factor NusB [Blattabacterium cuenoti]|uniref:transcription antitermination factor NusB n=1 Tax=Blattabacterium cuenoti TaxID=1653831 RepID=UPI00163BDEC6|nr:transcription antitermination factor NusB [Blattabacterium cuenoti]
MQFLYAQYLSKMTPEKVEKNMLVSIEELHEIYISLLYLILKIRDYAIFIIANNKKKMFSNLKKEEENKIEISQIQKLVDNSIIKILSHNKHLLEYNPDNDKMFWGKKNEYIVLIILKETQKSNIFNNSSNKYHSSSSFEKEKKFIIKYYKNFVISNKKLIEYIEDKYINGLYDLCLAHIMVCKTLQHIKSYTPKNFQLYNICNDENKKFVIDLYRNTISHKKEFNHLIEKISKNWDINRISILDLIILQMAICEFLYFPNIPPKSTINEYIEISKIFCTKKSKIFINGILDKIFKLLYKMF